MFPFDHYPQNGDSPLGQPAAGDGTCRHGYGLDVARVCGWTCSYCGRAMNEPYESWLSISADHVVPRNVLWYAQAQNWIEDKFNRVTCCRACNEFMNSYVGEHEMPVTVEQFIIVRNSMFKEKRELALKKHFQERNWYKGNIHNIAL